MLDVIMVVPLPISGWKNVVDREVFIDADGIEKERMVGTLPAMVDSLQWLKQINPDRDPPCRILVSINGGVRDDMVHIESYLKGLDFDWLTTQTTEVETEARCIEYMVQECRHEFLALVPGRTLIRDRKWTEKMQVVYNKDRNCCMVGTDNTVKDNNFPPYKLSRTSHPSGGLVLLRKNILDSIDWGGMDEGPLSEQVSMQIEKIRGNRWIAPSVRFSDQEWASTTLENSGSTIPSE